MRDQEILDLANAYMQICEQQVGIPIPAGKSAEDVLQKMIPKGEKVLRPKESKLQNAHYEPKGELVDEQETARGLRLIDPYDKAPYSDDAAAAKNPVKMKRKGPKMKGVVRREEVEIAAQYFYEMGLNEEGVEILIEELGVEEFAEFVYDIAEEYVLTEARAGGAKIEPVTASGKQFKSGKPTGKSLQRLRDKKAARKEAESKASESKPSGLKASLQRQSAVAAAAKKQPKKPGLLDRVAGAVNKGIERHNAAMSAARETGKTIRKAAGHIGGVAREVGKGASGAAKLAGHVARKGLNDEYIVGYLIDEGYAETEESAFKILENMSEDWRESIFEASGEWFGGLRDKMRSAKDANMQRATQSLQQKPLPSVASPFAKPASRNDSGRLTTYGAGGGAAAEAKGQTRTKVMQQGAKNLENKKSKPVNQGPDFGR